MSPYLEFLFLFQLNMQFFVTLKYLTNSRLSLVNTVAHSAYVTVKQEMILKHFLSTNFILQFKSWVGKTPWHYRCE